MVSARQHSLSRAVAKAQASPTTSLDQGILTAIGNTPLVRLGRSVQHLDLTVYAKLEGLNPGGSAKDRTAANILRQAIRSGAVAPGMVVVESSSGNMGIGLAQACAHHGLQFICVVDQRTSPNVVKMLTAYGAVVDLVTKPSPTTGDLLQARLARVQELLAITPNSFWPNQYANLANPHAHQATMDELVSALGRIDYVFCATSTCGTLRGCSEYIRDRQLPIKTIAVDAVGSVIFQDRRGPRLLPGHGAGVRPSLFKPNMASSCVHVTDLDCVMGCRRLVRREGILVGASSGGTLAALEKLRDRIPPRSVCVLIMCDRGERYLDTVFSDPWVISHLGTLPEIDGVEGGAE